MAIGYKVVTYNRGSYPGRAIRLTYAKGETVTSTTELGIFIFKTRKDAEDYVTGISSGREARILRVQTIGRGRRAVCCPFVDRRDDFGVAERTELFINAGLDKYRLKYRTESKIGIHTLFKNVDIWWCAKGTMMYPAVKVLD